MNINTNHGINGPIGLSCVRYFEKDGNLDQEMYVVPLQENYYNMTTVGSTEKNDFSDGNSFPFEMSPELLTHRNNNKKNQITNQINNTSSNNYEMQPSDISSPSYKKEDLIHMSNIISSDRDADDRYKKREIIYPFQSKWINNSDDVDDNTENKIDPLIVKKFCGNDIYYARDHDKIDLETNKLFNVPIEPLLQNNESRYTLFPIVYNDVWDFYKRALASIWTVEEVDLNADLKDWNGLTDDERNFISNILAFFSGADSIEK